MEASMKINIMFGGNQMKKLAFLVVVLLMAQLSYGLESLTYTCDFEAGEQGTAFTTGALTGQGSPAWQEVYRGWDYGGVVVAGDAYSGSQYAVISGYQSSRLDFGYTYVPKYIEFAFKPQFDSTNDDVAWVMTQRGPLGSVFGIYMYMESANGNIQIWDLEAGTFVNVGQYANNQWQTISFVHTIVEYPPDSGEMIYQGDFDVYLNGQLVGTSLGYTYAYYAMQSLIFSTAESSWAHGGTLCIDGINIGETSLYIPEPTTMSLLTIGLAAMLRRRNA